jgi:hypothetical protein
MALQTAAALQRRSEPPRRITHRRKMNAISPIPAASRRFVPVIFCFPARFQL